MIGAGIYFWYSRVSFDKEQVSLDVFGQERIVSGEDIKYVVRYKNNTNASLNNAKITFLLPARAITNEKDGVSVQNDQTKIIRNVGIITSGQEGQQEFSVRALGDKDSQQKFLAKLEYRPSNINSDFSNEKEFVSTIISVPLVLNFDLPARIISGQTLNFSLKYVNISDATFTDSKLKIEYPAGFVYEGSFPSPSEGDNIWSLAEIGSGEESKIVIKGTISGNEGETKLFKAQIGTQKENEFIAFAQTLNSPQVSISPLYVEQSLDGQDLNSVKLEQLLAYKVKYRNTTDVAIGPVLITVKIDSQAVDFSSVRVEEGFFSSSDNTITWNASSLSGLQSLPPGEEGQVQFSLNVKSRLPINKYTDKNFTIITNAKIDSPNTPLSLVGTQLAGQNSLSVKINSQLDLKMKGYYSDKLFANSGPIPPRVGQKTTYTVYWQLINVSNDLNNVVVEGYLPSYVTRQGSIYPSSGEDVTYEPASGKITWKIGKLSAATGILLPVRQLIFQIALTPSISQVGNSVILVKDVKVNGEDTFTGTTVSDSVIDLQSSLPDDATIGPSDGWVNN
jgi:hypothetical protein